MQEPERPAPVDERDQEQEAERYPHVGGVEHIADVAQSRPSESNRVAAVRITDINAEHPHAGCLAQPPVVDEVADVEDEVDDVREHLGAEPGVGGEAGAGDQADPAGHQA